MSATHTTIWVTKAVAERLKAMAAEVGANQGDFINSLLNQYESDRTWRDSGDVVTKEKLATGIIAQIAKLIAPLVEVPAATLDIMNPREAKKVWEQREYDLYTLAKQDPIYDEDGELLPFVPPLPDAAIEELKVSRYAELAIDAHINPVEPISVTATEVVEPTPQPIVKVHPTEEQLADIHETLFPSAPVIAITKAKKPKVAKFVDPDFKDGKTLEKALKSPENMVALFSCLPAFSSGVPDLSFYCSNLFVAIRDKNDEALEGLDNKIKSSVELPSDSYDHVSQMWELSLDLKMIAEME